MKSPLWITALAWIGTYLVAGAVFSLAEVAWSMSQAMNVERLESLESGTTNASFIVSAVAPILVATWVARRVHRARSATGSGEGAQ